VLFPTLTGIQNVLFFLSVFGFAIGFLFWSSPSIGKAWKHPIGKVAISVGHVIVLLFATVFARFVVASALGLPPQDFELTVSFLAFLLYLPAWSLVVSFILGVAAIVFQIWSYLSKINKSVQMIGHMFGALAICFFAEYSFDFVFNNEASLHPLVRHLAFVADYQPAPEYPGIKPKERIRLHENGIISSARRENGKVLINIRNYDGIK
jgi:hypothetical protein